VVARKKRKRQLTATSPVLSAQIGQSAQAPLQLAKSITFGAGRLVTSTPSAVNRLLWRVAGEGNDLVYWFLIALAVVGGLVGVGYFSRLMG